MSPTYPINGYPGNARSYYWTGGQTRSPGSRAAGITPRFSGASTGKPRATSKTPVLSGPLRSTLSKILGWLRQARISTMLLGRYTTEVIQMFGGLCLWSLVFIPFPKSMGKLAKKVQRFSTNRFLTGPKGKPDLGLIRDKSLKAAIREYHINLKDTFNGTMSADMKKKLHIDPVTDDIKVHAWHVPAPAGQPTAIVHHGRGSNIMHLESVMQAFRKKKMGVIVYDYPGFGRSGGSPSPESLYKSGLALSLFADSGKQMARIPIQDQIIFGNSLGSIVAANTAKALEEMGKPAPKGLVLANPLPSIIDVFRHFRDRFHLGWLYNEKRLTLDMEAIEPLKALKQTPVQIIRGAQDKYIPIDLVRKMFQGIGDARKVPFYQGDKHLKMEIYPQLHHRLKDSDYPFLVDEVEKFIQA